MFLNKFPQTLTFRLTLWYALIFVTCLTFAFFVLYLSLSSILDDRIDEDLHEDLTEYALVLDSGGIAKVIHEIERELKTSEINAIFIRLYDKNGQQIFSSDLAHWEGLVIDPITLRKELASISSPVLESIKLPSQEYKTRMVYGLIGPNTVLQIGESLKEKEELIELLLMVFAVMFCVVIPLASGVGWFMARKAVSGIKEVSSAVVDIERGVFNRRVVVEGQGDEIQELADAFNAMADRIKCLISEMREMIDNIAHDLRSPLARIRAISEVALSADGNGENYKIAIADTLEDCDRLIQLINATLDVAEAEAGITNTVKEEVYISKVVEDACELFEPVAEEKRIDLSLKLESDCHLFGDRQNLQRMLANILDNAVKYTPFQGKISVGLVRSLQEIIINVADTGIGIPLSDQKRVFERFFRCDQSRNKDGCGLGLSFAHAVARAHGGNITIDSVPSERSVFTITLPV